MFVNVQGWGYKTHTLLSKWWLIKYNEDSFHLSSLFYWTLLLLKLSLLYRLKYLVVRGKQDERGYQFGSRVMMSYCLSSHSENVYVQVYTQLCIMTCLKMRGKQETSNVSQSPLTFHLILQYYLTWCSIHWRVKKCFIIVHCLPESFLPVLTYQACAVL
jgi:hypothetical protein